MTDTTASLIGLTVAGARDQLDARIITSVELTEAHLRQIDEVDATIQSYIHVMAEQALQQALVADERIRSGNALPLTGIPIALKDVLCTIDAPTTAGSQMLRGLSLALRCHCRRSPP